MTPSRSAPVSPARGSPPGSPVSSPTLARSPATPARPVRRTSKRPRTSMPPRSAAASTAAAAATTTAAPAADARSDGDGGACSTPSPSKGVVKTRRAARTPASVMGRHGSASPGGVVADRRRGRRVPPASAVTRRLALDFGDAPATGAASSVADATASVRAAATTLSAAVADEFAARWDFDVRRGQPVESPAVWHWSPVEA